jgi:hypothetical protein
MKNLGLPKRSRSTGPPPWLLHHTRHRRTDTPVIALNAQKPKIENASPQTGEGIDGAWRKDTDRARAVNEKHKNGNPLFEQPIENRQPTMKNRSMLDD